MSNSIVIPEKSTNKENSQINMNLNQKTSKQSNEPLIEHANIENCIRIIFPDDQGYIKGYN